MAKKSVYTKCFTLILALGLFLSAFLSMSKNVLYAEDVPPTPYKASQDIKDDEYYKPVLNTLDSSDCAYFLYDTEKGQTLLSKDMDKFVDASLLARLMSSLIIIQNMDLADKVISIKTERDENGFTIVEGFSYEVSDLLESTILDNCSNTISLLSERVSLNKPFVEHMNDLAEQFGMYDTYFTSPDGKYSPLQKTTVRDMAVFLAKALSNSRFRNIFCSPVAINSDGIIIKNSNPIVIANTSDTRGGAVSKDSSGDSYSTFYYLNNNNSKISESRHLILVTAGIGDAYIENGQNALLSRFRASIKKVCAYEVGDIVNSLPVGERELKLLAGNSLYFYSPVNENNYIDSISYSYLPNMSPDAITPPIYENIDVGVARIRLKDGTVAEISLYTGNEVLSKKAAVNRFLSFVTEYYDMILLIGALSLFIILLIIVKLIFHITINLKR